MPVEVALEEDVRHPLVLMRFDPVWSYIEGISAFGRFFCQATFRSSKLAQRVQVIIQEALENAVKYSGEGPHSELELRIVSRGNSIEISVSSLPDPDHLDVLKRELERINAHDPATAFLEAVVRVANSTDAASRLGLARIRHEGEVELSIQEEEGGRIRLTASGTL